MKERGMIFNGEMVRAILDGRKTQTRRPVKFPHIDRDAMCELSGNELAGELSAGNYRNCPHGKPGDRIWVRETFSCIGNEDGHPVDADGNLCSREDAQRIYRASAIQKPGNYGIWTSADDFDFEGAWTPSIHMPRWASRITLEITGVRVERLNSISQEDAQAEGMELTGWRPTYSDPDSGGEVWTPYDNFAQLWESIYGEESWKANPWVWVIEFKVASPGGE
ncbi:morphogenetic protein [Enterobacter kobei]|uniref:morphogenetic protein n=1 Tax=Enterobacter kobei TaxID=208224 RepID=UPI001C63C27B|nr:morphogenetic protein [Enterobacter kobei]MBW7715595.1 morphogenetic protein [Enterobacter kobei]MBW7723822.1 morphogenetic protein [Enterobacter kobei]